MTDQQPSSDWREHVGGVALTSFIINSALVAGVVVFAVIVLVQNGFDMSGESDVLMLVLSLFFLATLPPRFVVPMFIDHKAAAAVREGKSLFPNQPNNAELREKFGEIAPLLAAYQTRTIVAAALLEGVAFFAVIVYLIDRTPIALGLVALLILALIAQTPTKDRVIAYVERGLSKAKGVMER